MLLEQSHAVPILGVPSGGFEGVHAIGDTRDRVGVASGDRSCVCDRPDCFRLMIMARHNPQHDADGRVDEDAALERLGCPSYKI